MDRAEALQKLADLRKQEANLLRTKFRKMKELEDIDHALHSTQALLEGAAYGMAAAQPPPEPIKED